MHPDLKGPIFSHVGLSDLSAVAQDFVNQMDDYRVWLCRGEMGAGKTTLIKTICSELGVADVMSSPTFSIINEYRTTQDEVIYHFDFYRIRSEAEALDIGTDEYLYSGNICFIEWPEKIQGILPSTFGEIRITHVDKEHRTIAISFHA
jgi:tRNA threonylcarbamoyladenosine biosynthesis protein TsaE